ncbi:DNA topoisomerase 3 [Fluviicola sp.]|jgi:DNA topoisomerase-3|uniref:type IA DNA topoisomerase n=1 Tax=Fluviicola sp. TaxID=1917219 RepID=UPI002826A4EC|nr:DNA topoisomerase 3 [Fluviicola sp.]MDR0803267.1 DNA topoisomerase 3 [Fluviicola sp.]
MILCIAEKPSVAKDIAEVIGARQRHDGFYEGNGYWVTWTFGHLCTLKEPHDYHEKWKYWKLEDLPIIPEKFGIKLIDDSGVKKQFSVIEKLVASCSEVINCGDAGQEGELIQRWVLSKAKCRVPLKRLWISSLTEEAIRDGFQSLRAGEQYQNLYAAGSARAIGDWLLGMNATRLFTKKFGQGKATLSIGRVQTPTLAMIVNRQKEIEVFRVEEYWELKTFYRETEFSATIDRLQSQERADKGLAYLQEHPFEITSFERKEGKEGNPRLFDLTSLQVESNKKIGNSAEETLKLVQSLYEKKLITYPRVDTTYLSEDLHPKIEGVMKGMTYYSRFTESVLAKPIPKLKTVFDDKKVTDHHAIIPTGIQSGGISHPEQQIYDMIARRFIAAFYPECKVSNTVVLGKVGQIEFKATGKQIIEPGWRVVWEETKENEIEGKKSVEKPEQTMPHFVEGEIGPHQPFIHQGKTSPPKPYTEATLLRAMETAGKMVEDEELRDMMKENGIGRPATRANIIETLFKRKYIEKKRKNLIATSTGMGLIDTIQNELLKSAELTGQWERKLRLIEKGEYDLEQFKRELMMMVRELTDEVIFSQAPARIHLYTDQSVAVVKEKKERKKAEKQSITDLDCPKCKSHKLITGKTGVGCSNFKVCGFMIPFEILGKKLTEKQLIDLVSKGKTSKMKGLMIPGSHQVVEGSVALDENFNMTVL